MTSSKRNTRCKTRKSECFFIFGSPTKLFGNVLPTYADIMKFYMKTRNNLKTINESKEPTVSDITEIVAVRVEQIWCVRSMISIEMF